VSRIRYSPGDRWVFQAPFSSSRYGYRVDRRRSGEHHRHLAQVLSDGGEHELIAGTAWATQSQPPHTQDALEMGEQHLDRFVLAA